MNRSKIDDEVHSNTGIPRDLWLRTEELRLVRARRTGHRPSLKSLVAEGLELLLREAQP